MLFKEFGSPDKPTVILLHGAGLSWWAYREVAALLQRDYHVVLPVIDGYGEDVAETFESIERSADKLIDYIVRTCGGHVLAVGGLSIGGQIVAEALSRKADIADFAVLESALVCPIPGTKSLTVPMINMSFGLIKKRWFAKWQAKALFVPDALFEEYYTDSLRISRQSLVNTLLSNGTYQLRDSIATTGARTLILVGEREVAAELRSARLLYATIPRSELYIAPGLKHGELSLNRPEEYVRRITDFFNSRGANKAL